MKKQARSFLLFLSLLILLPAVEVVATVWPAGAELGRPPAMPAGPPTEQTLPAGLDPVAYLPVMTGPAGSSPWVNTQSRTESGDFFLSEYLASEGVPSEWTGNHAGCDAGTTSVAFKEAVLRRINYFRGMAGIPAVTAFKDEYNMKAQEAALMMSVNDMLSHNPDPSWLCYTAAGDEGAGSSNLYLGVYGPDAITGYMVDPGGGNYFVGHRRWVLYPQSQYLGTGDIPPAGTYRPSNALWVFDQENMWGDRPGTREDYVAWPPPGYVPYQVVFFRWSFAYAQADFSNAVVTMTRNGQPLSLQQNAVVGGFGENTLVWEPDDTFGQPPGSDIVYEVTIENVLIGGQPQNFAYQVIVFEP